MMNPEEYITKQVQKGVKSDHEAAKLLFRQTISRVLKTYNESSSEDCLSYIDSEIKNLMSKTEFIELVRYGVTVAKYTISKGCCESTTRRHLNNSPLVKVNREHVPFIYTLIE